MSTIKNIKYLLMLTCLALTMYSFSAVADDYSWVTAKLVNETGKTIQVVTNIKNKGFQVLVSHGATAADGQSLNIEIGIPVVHRTVEGDACDKWMAVSGDQGHFSVCNANDSLPIATVTIDTFDVYGKFKGNSDMRMSGLYFIIDGDNLKYSATAGNLGSSVVNAVYSQVPVNDYNLQSQRLVKHNYITYRSKLNFSDRYNSDSMTIVLGKQDIPEPTASMPMIIGNKLKL